MSYLQQIIDYGDYLATAKDANGNFWLVVKGNKDPNAVDPSGRPVLYPLLLFEYRGVINEGPPTYGNFVGDIRFNGQDGTQYAGIFGYSRNGYALTFDCDANAFGCSFTANNNQDRLNVIYPSLTGETYTGQDGKTYNQIDSTNPFTIYDGSFRMLMNNRRLGARVTASNLTSLGVLHTLTTGKKSVAFARASQQFIQLGYPSFNLTFAKTGCSAIAVVRFTGSAGNNERVFEAATGNNGQNSFCVYRYGTTNKLACAIYNGTTRIGLVENVGTIVQDVWTTIVSVYNKTATTLQLYQDGSLLGSVVCSAAATDKTMTWEYSYLGKSTFASDSYSNYNVAALFLSNSALSSTDVGYINATNYEGLIYKGGLQLSDSTVSSYFPLFYTGSLVDKNVGESLFSWNGNAYQVTAANQPTVAQETYLTSNSTGLTVNGAISGGTLSLQTLANTTTSNVLYYDTTTKAVSYGAASTPSLLPITLDTVNNRVGVNKTVPTSTLDVNGEITTTSINVTNFSGYRINNSVFLSTRSSGSVGLGFSVHNNVPGTNAVAIGNSAGNTTQGASSVSIGLNAGQTSQAANAVAVGVSAGSNTQGTNSVAVGNTAGQTTQGDSCVAVGVNAGQNTQTGSSIAIGPNAGRYTQGSSAVAVGSGAGAGTTTAGTGQGSSAVAVGVSAGSNTQGAYSVAVGSQAGQTTQGIAAVAVGHNAGNSAQATRCVAIGEGSGMTNQKERSVSIGFGAGSSEQDTLSVAIGSEAGRYNQGSSAVAIGSSAGTGTTTAGTGQGTNAVAVGSNAGQDTQGASATAVGVNAGQTSQGSNAVAVGNSAGQTNQHANSIILNASGVALNSDGTSRFYVKPVRNNTTATSLLQYDATSGEITYGPSNVAGTLTTAAQPNVTSLGTLTNVNTSGVYQIGGTDFIASRNTNSVAVGVSAGSNTQGTNAVAVGVNAGQNTQTGSSIAIGPNAGRYTQGSSAVAVGSAAGAGTTTAGTGQGANAIAVGVSAGSNTQGASATAVGANAGQTSQGSNAVAVGNSAGQTNQHANSVILNATGFALNSDGTSRFYVKPIRNENSVQSALLNYNSTTGEITYGIPGFGTNAVAVGPFAGWGGGVMIKQLENAVALGNSAGRDGQQTNATAVGAAAGMENQQSNSTAIGRLAGAFNQGALALALGYAAGQTNQHANSIILNAGNVALNSDGTSRFYVKPVRNNTTATSLLQYDATSGEITYGPSNVAGTLTTAAQPNITSVGTLGSLSVTGSASAGTLSLQSIANTSTSNVLYYNTTSKAVSYGAASVFTPTQTKTTTTVSQATGPSDTTLVSLTSLAVGWYHVTASYQWQLNNNGGASQNTLKTVFKLYKGSSIVANDFDQPGDYTVSYGTMSAVVEIAAGDSVSLTVATPNTPGNAVMDIVTANTFLTVTKIA